MKHKLPNLSFDAPIDWPFVGMFLAVVVGLVVVVWVGAASSKASFAEHERAYQAQVAAFKGAMWDQDCKVTSFVATRSQPRAVWTCPDGHVELEP